MGANALDDIARDQLGHLRHGVPIELRKAAKALEPGEEPVQLAMGVVNRRSRVALLTDRALLLAPGWSPVRRKRAERWPLEELTEVERHLMTVRIGFGARGSLTVALSPDEAAHRIADALLTRLDGDDKRAARRNELAALADRKLGDGKANALRADLAQLADGLEPGEDVQRLAEGGDEHGPLTVALTDRRLIVVHAALRAANDRWTAWPRDEIARVEREGQGLRIYDARTAELDDGPVGRFVVFLDRDRCDEFEMVLR